MPKTGVFGYFLQNTLQIARKRYKSLLTNGHSAVENVQNACFATNVTPLDPVQPECPLSALLTLAAPYSTMTGRFVHAAISHSRLTSPAIGATAF
jgi:hypothetical protein